MISYKDMTFCQDWCKNTDCSRNYSHIKQEMEPEGFLAKNPWMPVCYYVDPPVDCSSRIPND